MTFEPSFRDGYVVDRVIDELREKLATTEAALAESRGEVERLTKALRGVLRAINNYEPGWPHPESEIGEAMKSARSTPALLEAPHEST